MGQSLDSERRNFMKQVGCVLVGAVATSRCPAASARVAVGSLTDLTATDAVAAMRRGEIKAEAYATALLDRATATEALNAFVTLDREAILEAARNADRRRRAGKPLGRLHGMPIPIKDSIITKSWPTSLGSGGMRHFVSSENAPVVAALLRAGAIVMGKTNLHEMSYGWTSNNAVTGAVHNPYRITHIAGGSSGGSAAAVAARVAPLSLAADTFGSVRVPASMCGICGLRPSFLRYPNEGVQPIAPTIFDSVGPLARTVSDLVLFDSVVARAQVPVHEIPLKGVRLGIDAGYFFTGVDSSVRQIIDQAFDRLKAAGVVLVQAPLPEPAMHAMDDAFSITSHDTVPALKLFLQRYVPTLTFEDLLDQMSPEMQATFKDFAMPGGADYTGAEEYRLAQGRVRVIRSSMREYFRANRLDAIAFPTTLVAAQPIGENREVEISGAKIAFSTAVAQNVAIGTCASLPGLVIPAGMAPELLPVGMEFDGPRGTDRRILGLGLSIEALLGQLPAPAV